MQNKKQKLNYKIIALILFLIGFGIAGRMIPHLWNATPIVAIGLFSFHYINKKYAWIMPLLILGVSDIFLGFYDWKLLIIVYGSFALVTLFGKFIHGTGRKKISGILFAPILASTFFFLVTNWAVWQFSPWYNHNLFGLLDSYAAGLPFLRNMLVGDLVFTTALFGAYEYVPKLSFIWKHPATSNESVIYQPKLNS